MCWRLLSRGSAAPGVAGVARDAAFTGTEASILGTDRRVALPQAAMTNTAAAIAQEVEEGHNTGGHVGAGIVAGGLAAAEANDVDDGEAFVDACTRERTRSVSGSSGRSSR